MTAIIFLLRPEVMMMGVYCKVWAFAAFFCTGLTMAVLRDSKWSWLWLGLLGATIAPYGAFCAHWLFLAMLPRQAAIGIVKAAILALILNPQLWLHPQASLATVSIGGHQARFAGLAFSLRENFLTLPGIFIIYPLLTSLGNKTRQVRRMWYMFAPSFLAMGFLQGEYSYRMVPLYPLMTMLAMQS